MHVQAQQLERTPRVSTGPYPYLNLGCGARFHLGWTNADLHPVHESVRCLDVAFGPLPFPDAGFAAVYHSHLLEHLPCDRTVVFLQECRRVLQPGGVVRVVVPDLEQIARLYLLALEDAWDHRSGPERHAWMTLEMLDQLVREKPGGAMLDRLSSRPNDQFALSRLGAEAASILHHVHERKRLLEELRVLAHDGTGDPARDSSSVLGGEGTLLASARPSLESGAQQIPGWWQRLRTRLHAWVFGSWRERLARWVVGRDYALLQLGRFRRAGEIHHWMYDRYSLRELLHAVGFRDIRLVDAMESAIPDWADFHLDVLSDGSVAKPDSLYMEARN